MRWIFLFFSFSLWAALDVSVDSPSAILIDAHSGVVLFEKEAHTPRPPASITKIATALFILEHKKIPLEQVAKVSKEALKMKPRDISEEVLSYWLEPDGTRMGLRVGEILPIESLLHGLLLVSGNDAANVLAEAASGSVPVCMEEMNAFLEEIGCKNTKFQNPHGLHHEEHYTTAYDIAFIAKRALENPIFREICAKRSYVKPKTNRQSSSEIFNTNRLLKPGKSHYDKAFGVKAGYTSRALNTLVGAAEHEGRVLIAAVLGAAQGETRYADVKRLFETAFQEEQALRRFFGKEHLFKREVLDGTNPLQARIREDLSFTYYPAEEREFHAFVLWQPPPLPITQGDKVGVVFIADEEGKRLVEQDLFAVESVKRTFFGSLKKLLGL